jgi:hypothetical protein
VQKQRKPLAEWNENVVTAIRRATICDAKLRNSTVFVRDFYETAGPHGLKQHNGSLPFGAGDLL